MRHLILILLLCNPCFTIAIAHEKDDINGQAEKSSSRTYTVVLTGKEFSGSLPGPTGNRHYGVNIKFQGIENNQIQGTMITYFPQCSGNFPFVGVVNGAKIDFTVKLGVPLCTEEWTASFEYDDVRKRLSGKIVRPNYTIETTLR